MFWTKAVTASMLATGAYATNLYGAGIGAAVSPSHLLESRMVDFIVEPVLAKRQSSSSSLNLTSTGTLNMTQWNTDTTNLCMQALSQLTQASNPSGTAICYNLPSLDTNTGAFMADLRLFQVSSPSGDFANIPPEKIEVGLSYRGASVSPISTNVTKRGLDPRDTTTPKELQSYMFVGQIDQAQMAQPMTMGILEALVMPTVTLNGVSGVGATVATNVSSNEAAFVNGIFSNEVILSDLALAQLAVNDMVNGLHNGTVAFVLPGLQLMLFPVGLIITGLWLVIGVSFYAWGTFERIGYRDSYHSRKAAFGKPTSAARI